MTNPYYNSNIKMELVKGITVLWCGRCEREFLAKLKDGQDDPTYVCPKCQATNKFAIQWK